MARKRMKSKIQPAVMKLWFAVPNWDGVSSQDTNHFIDLSQCASLANRRFYRQGLNWAVSDICLHTSSVHGQTYIKPGTSFSIGKLPNTWIVSNAWEKSFRAWTQMNKEALDETSVKPKFHDFKIYADVQHHRLGFLNNLLPLGHAPGEWISSKLNIPNSDDAFNASNEYEIIAVGPNYPGVQRSNDAVSMIEGYAASRALPTAFMDPNRPKDADDAGGPTPENWIQALTNEGTDQDAAVLENLLDDNNQAPYPFENGIDPNGVVIPDTMYPGGANNASALEQFGYFAIAGTTVSTRHHFGGTNVPCGLIHIKNSLMVYNNPQFSGNALDDTYSIVEVTLVPGDHRGYLAEPMTEM